MDNRPYSKRKSSQPVFFIVLYLLSCDVWLIVHSKKTDLHIGGVFPINGTGGWQGGQACEPAAQMAFHDVNNNDLLSGYNLRLHWFDSGCESGRGASALHQLLYNDPVKVFLLAGCSAVCKTVAEEAKKWNLIVLCYGASSPSLSNRNRFETLFRTHPSATVHNPTRIKLMQKFGWSRVAILQQAEEVFISTADDLEARCKTANIEIVTRQSFLTDPTEAVRNLKRQDARIVVGMFYVVAARRVLCEIFKQKLYGNDYVWFFIGWYEDNWYEMNLEQEGISCTKEEMKLAAEGHLTTEPVMWNQDNRKTVSGMTADEFKQRLDQELKKKGFDLDNGHYPEGYHEAPLAYDAVWALALAFNKTIVKLAEQGKKLENFRYERREIRDEIYNALNSTRFLGVSGKTAFSEKGDRIALTQVEQMNKGQYKLLGYYDAENLNLTWYDKEQWMGGEVPQDMSTEKTVLRKVSLPLFISMCTVAGIGILWAVLLILFTFIYRERKVIKLSHPVTNALMLVGHAFCFVFVFLVGLDGQFVTVTMFTVMCTLRTWVLSIGFTLAYGAMFSKVWHVYRLTTKSDNVRRGFNKMQPRKFYLLFATLVGIEIIYLTIWTLVDPLRRTMESFQPEFPEYIHFLPQLEHCESIHNNFWLGITYSFKGLLLIFGLFLAYETRSSKVRHINDSRLVAMSICIVAVLCLITTPVTMIISSQQDASFALVALAITFSSMITMGLVHIPKIIEVIQEGNEKSDHSHAPGDGTTKEEEERH